MSSSSTALGQKNLDKPQMSLTDPDVPTLECPSDPHLGHTVCKLAVWPRCRCCPCLPLQPRPPLVASSFQRRYVRLAGGTWQGLLGLVILNHLTMEYCICIRTREGISYEIWPEPKEVPEGEARGNFRGLRPCFIGYPDSSPNTDIIPFL